MSDGKHTATRLRAQVEIEFATVTDVTADVVSLEVKRGRSSEQDTTSPGTARIVLQDTDGSYDPTLNEALVDPVTSATWSGPNAPYVTPGRNVTIRVSDIGSVVEALRPDRYFELADPAGTVAFDRGASGGLEPSVAVDGTYTGSTWGSGPNRLFCPHLLEQEQLAPVFPGNGHYVTSNSTIPVQDLLLPRTYMMWAYRDAGSDGYLFSVDEQIRMSVGLDAKLTVDLWVDDGGTDGWASFTANDFIMDPGVWHLIALVSGPSVEPGWRLYIDGEFVVGATGTTAVGARSDAPLLIGAYDPATLPAKCWAGGIKDVAVWYDRALTYTQLQRLTTMSQTGLPWFTGRALSWDVRAPEVPFGRSEVTVSCVDVANDLLQNEVDVDIRSALLATKPTQLFTLDDEEGQDLQGGVAVTIAGGEVVRANFDPVRGFQVFRELLRPSVRQGISAGAIEFGPTGQPGAGGYVGVPTVPNRDLRSFCFWFRMNGPDGEDNPSLNDYTNVQVVSCFASAGSSAPFHFIRVTPAGKLEYVQLIFSPSFSRVVEATGQQTVTTDTWRFVWVDVDTDNDKTYVYVDNELDFEADVAWPENPFRVWHRGNVIRATIAYDEMATWYAPDVPPAYGSFERNRIYELAKTGYEQQTTRERVDTILDFAGYTGATELSTITGTRCNRLTAGNVWSLLQQTAQTEAGTVDVAGDGTVRFKSRYDRRWAGAATAAGENPSSGVNDVTFITDDRYLYNSVRVDNATFVEDSTSVTDYGRRSLSISPNLFDANERAVRAQGLVELYKDYRPRSDRARWDLSSPLGGLGLIVDVNDLLTVRRTLFSTNVNAEYTTDVWVEQLTLTLDGRSKLGTVTAELSPVDVRQNDYWQLDRSLLDSTDVLGW